MTTVTPVLGCAFGGFWYDVFICTGESPISTPWTGTKRIVRPNLKGRINGKYVEMQGYDHTSMQHLFAGQWQQIGEFGDAA